jgi:hypothetical protein
MSKKHSFIFKSTAALFAFALVFAACSQTLQPEDDAFASNALSVSRLPSKVGLPPDSWATNIPQPFDNTAVTAINGLTANGADLLAVGYTGSVAYTSLFDGSIWSEPVALTSAGVTLKPSSAHFFNCTYLITVGSSSTTGAFSEDGETWSSTGTIGFGTKAGVFGPKERVYVVAGQNGQAAYTTDLSQTFTVIPNTITGWTGTGGPYYINAGAYGNGVYVFGGGSGQIAYTIGVTGPNAWTQVAEAPDIFTATGFVNVIVYGTNGTFVAAGNDANNAGVIAYSTNSGVTWTGVDLSSLRIGSATIYALAYGNGYFTAVNDLGIAAYSLDGIDWVSSNTVVGFSQVNAATYYEATNTFFAGGAIGTSPNTTPQLAESN